MDKVRWGIIGCGDVAEVKSGPAFQLAEKSELTAVMRRSSKYAEDYAKRHNVPKWYNDADLLINDRDVDAVYIATPPSSHMEYTLKAAEAGKPVYVEKPMALNYAECKKMIDACEDARVPLFVAYYRRALPKFLKIKEFLADGAAGEIRAVTTSLFGVVSDTDLNRRPNWRTDPAIAGCGYFCDLASHTLDILQFFFGAINKVSGFSGNQQNLYAAEDTVSAAMVFDSGVHLSGIWNFSSFQKFDRTEIIGNKGKITFSTFGNNPIIFESGMTKKEILIENPLHIQQPLIQSIVNELTGRGRCPGTGRTGAETSKVIDAILKGS